MSYAAQMTRILTVGLGFLLCGYVAVAQTAVVLVGTGGPELTAERQGEATLVETHGQMLLFDAGRGVLDGLYRSRVRPQEVTRVFLTHLHSDHIEGLPGTLDDAVVSAGTEGSAGGVGAGGDAGDGGWDACDVCA